MTLYNLKSSDGAWRITKFTNDLEVESSYITSLQECECPAGSRPTCRHRQMLPKMLNVGAEDSGMFYDFERDQFLEPITDDTEDTQPAIVSPVEEEPETAAAGGPNVSALFLDGLSQTVHTTVNYMEDGSVEIVEHKPTPSPSFTQIHDGAVTPEMERVIKSEAPHPAISGTLRRRI